MSDQAKPQHHRYRRYSKSLQLLYKSKKAKTYTGVALTIFAIAFFTFFTIRPTLITIAGLLKEIEDQKVIAEKLEDKIESINLAQEEYKKAEDKLGLIDESFPEDTEFSTLVKQIELLVQVNNLEINSLNYNEVRLKEMSGGEESGSASSSQLKEISFKLSTSGTYEQLTVFISDLFRFRRVLEITDYSISKLSEKSQETLAIDLGLKAFYFK